MPNITAKSLQPEFDYNAHFTRLTGKGSPFQITEAIDGAPRQFIHRPRNLISLFAQIGQFEDRECIVHGDDRITYAMFNNRVRRIAGGLSRIADIGDRIAILGANHPDWMASFWGTIIAGMTPVALNGWWRGEELAHGIQLTEARVLIGDQKRMAKLPGSDAIPQIQRAYTWDGQGAALPISAAPLTSLLDEPLQDLPDVDEAHPAALIFTSGTTGRAKAAVISHGAWIAAGLNAALATSIEVERAPHLLAKDGRVRHLASLPFFHVGGGHGIVMGGIVGGQTIVFPKGKFDPEIVLKLIDEERIDRWSAVPAMVHQVCARGNPEGYDLSSLKTLGYGAAPSRSDLRARAAALFPSLGAVSNAYGLTESGSIFAMNTGIDLEQRPQSVGRPFATADIRIVDEAEKELPCGARGEIQVRGPFLMTGYWNDPKATNLAIAPGGWLRTGDIGHLDEEGFLYLDGRKKDIIIRGGENIQPEEVERRIETHPAVKEAAVIAVESEELGEEAKAVICLKNGGDLTEEAVREWVAEELAYFKVPRFVEFRAEPLPRNAAGKLLKNMLRTAEASQFDEFFA